MTFPESYTKTLSLLPYFGEMAMVVTDGKILCLCRFNLSPRQHLQNEIKNSKANFRNKAKTNFKVQTQPSNSKVNLNSRLKARRKPNSLAKIKLKPQNIKANSKTY